MSLSLSNLSRALMVLAFVVGIHWSSLWGNFGKWWHKLSTLWFSVVFEKKWVKVSNILCSYLKISSCTYVLQHKHCTCYNAIFFCNYLCPKNIIDRYSLPSFLWSIYNGNYSYAIFATILGLLPVNPNMKKIQPQKNPKLIQNVILDICQIETFYSKF